MGIERHRPGKREICLLRGFPWKWGRCSFCDYIADNSRDEDAMVKLNRQVLGQVTGELGVFQIRPSHVNLCQKTTRYDKLIEGN